MSELLPEIYDARFDDREAAAKDAIWREIVRFLQRYVDRSAPIMDFACDRGHFIRWAEGSERWASDIRDVRAALPDDVRFVQSSGLDLAAVVPNGTFGTVFMSNYLEHLDSSDAVIEQLRVVRQLLKPGGKVVVLQPNIRLIGGRYWDFIDHKVALTEQSLVEAAELAGLQTRRAHHAIPAIFDEGSPAGRPATRSRVPRVPPSLAPHGSPDAARRRGPRVTAPELSIVLPVFKEGEAVEPVIRALARDVRTPHEMLLVYDFDEDPTVPVIERLAAELPAVRGLRNDLGRGVLNAMKAGIAASSGPYVLITMSDGSDEPHIVDSMVALARDGADIVAGSRYMRAGGSSADRSSNAR